QDVERAPRGPHARERSELLLPHARHDVAPARRPAEEVHEETETEERGEGGEDPARLVLRREGSPHERDDERDEDRRPDLVPARPLHAERLDLPEVETAVVLRGPVEVHREEVVGADPGGGDRRGEREKAALPPPAAREALVGALHLFRRAIAAMT